MNSSRLASTLAAATIMAIFYIPSGIVFVVVSKHFGLYTIPVENFAMFFIGWMIAQGAAMGWQDWRKS